jgi:hypothetical protein
MTKPPEGVIASLTLSFYGKGTADQWRRYADEAGFSLKSSEGKAFALSFAALPEVVKEGAPYVVGGFHSCGDDKPDLVHWDLEMHRCADDAPPPDLLESSERIGGLHGLLRSLSALWPGAPEIELEITANLITRDLTIRAPSPCSFDAKPTVEAWGNKYSLVPKIAAQAWECEPPLGIVNSFLFIYDKEKTVNVRVTASLTTAITATMIELVEEQLWRSLSLFNAT